MNTIARVMELADERDLSLFKLVFLLNNWWRYLYENTRFYWNFQNGWYWPFSAILKSDIKYSIGIGKYRYWLSFFAAEIGLLVEMAFMREVLKKNKLLI